MIYKFNQITRQELEQKYPLDQEAIWHVLPFTSFFRIEEDPFHLMIKGKYSQVVEYAWKLEGFREEENGEVGYIIPIKIDVDLT